MSVKSKKTEMTPGKAAPSEGNANSKSKSSDKGKGKASSTISVSDAEKAMAKKAKSERASSNEIAPASSLAVKKSRVVSGSSRIFVPFRALGFISNGVPFALQVRHGGKDATTPDINIITCLEGSSSSSSSLSSSSSNARKQQGSGDTWAMWDAMHMRLLFVGPPAPATHDGGGKIVAMATSTSPDSLLVCYAGGSIRRFVRAREVARYDTWLRKDQRQRKLPRTADNNGGKGASSSSGSSSNSEAEDESSSDDEMNDGEAQGGGRNLLYPDDDIPHSPTKLARMIVFGDTICALSADGSALFVWNLLTTQLLRRVNLSASSIPLPSASKSRSDDPFVINNADRTATAILHPATYLNKVLLGFSDGSLQLWNIRTGQLIHHFDGRSNLYTHADHSHQHTPGDAPIGPGTQVVALVQSPAIDIIGIGFASGHVLLHDVRLDEPVFRMKIAAAEGKQDLQNGHVSLVGGVLSRDAISFRTDGNQHSIAVGGTSGNISIFSLDSSVDTAGQDQADSASEQQNKVRARPARLAHVIRAAHDAPIGGLQFVPGQALLISSSADNSYKQWFFDDADAIESNAPGSLAAGSVNGSAGVPPRLLRSRSGHHAPPHLVRHYGDDGKNILTASRDRSLRCLSVVRDSRSFELSQGSLAKKSAQLSVDITSLKLPPMTSLAFSMTRSRDWDDVITTHAGIQHARTWTVRDKRMSKHALAAVPDKTAAAAEARVGCVTACGNFGLVGTSLGKVECYNMQSGIHRRTYDTRAIDGAALQRARMLPPGKKRAAAEEAARIGRGNRVTGVASDARNRICVAATLEGTLHFFDFYTTDLIATLPLESSPSTVYLHQDSNLLAVACDDLTVLLVDIETRRVVREFSGFRGRVLDLCISSDARWLITTSMDSVVRTFDIPTATLVDTFKTPSVATSLSMSPSLDFLATAHVDSIGVYLWANKAQFSSVALRGLDELAEVADGDAEGVVSMPSLQGDSGAQELVADEEAEGVDVMQIYTSPPQLFADQNNRSTEGALTTLSTMPRSRWLTLINLDIIKKRDKPVEPPKQPEKAPFFLPQVAGTTFEFDTNAKQPAANKKGKEGARLLSGADLSFESDFVKRLQKANQANDASSFFYYVHALTPPALDAEIRSLASFDDLRLFIDVMTLRLQAHLDFEAVQAMLRVFLQIHSDLLIANGVTLATQELSGDTPMGTDGDDVNESSEEATALRHSIRALIVQQHLESARVLDLLDFNLGTLSFVRDIPLV
ncbi:WD40 repeat-like protein [Tilletiaria anomala UBC 951]|uniref:WD40 repeat-like protein n=1 Tax=Tilletiaria anomala (strain ATCC 24038 / CBS 436.72 / UBC 951) TaxID=1037660 RepID=A0A066VKX3_TILAU|nr:WD40 repeat-like protein [Tilletiaria anomala UBC 951]KDN39399.1 WD40 repeat-like protein [Tilletiaria anomala UBC 951]